MVNKKIGSWTSDIGYPSVYVHISFVRSIGTFDVSCQTLGSFLTSSRKVSSGMRMLDSVAFYVLTRSLLYWNLGAELKDFELATKVFLKRHWCLFTSYVLLDNSRSWVNIFVGRVKTYVVFKPRSEFCFLRWSKSFHENSKNVIKISFIFALPTWVELKQGRLHLIIARADGV